MGSTWMVLYTRNGYSWEKQSGNEAWASADVIIPSKVRFTTLTKDEKIIL